MSDTDQPIFSWEDLPPLTDAQVRAGALPGESWKAARERLEVEQRHGKRPVPKMDEKRPDYLQARPARPCKWLTAQRFVELQAQWQTEKILPIVSASTYAT